MTSLQEALDRFLQIDRSPFTNRLYRRILTLMVSAVGPVRDVARISYEDLADYFYPLVNGEKPLKRSTAANYLMVIQNFFTFCRRRGYITVSPAEELRVRIDEHEPRHDRAATPADLKKMLELARFNKRNLAILLFITVTGCRQGGISSLTLDKLDLDEMSALIKEKGGKWKRVYFGSETAAALRDWLAERPQCDHNYVFTASGKRGAHPLSRHAFRAVIESLSKRSGASRVYRTHALRHSRGHSFARNQVELSVAGRALGHSDPRITASTYYPNGDVLVAARVRQFEMTPFVEDQPVEKVIPLDKSDAV